MENFNQFVPNVHFEQIPIKNLVSNQGYQRELSLPHIKRTAANFDLRQINPVKVSRRDGSNHVFNGQHTIETVAFVSKSRETPVWCMIYNDLEYKAEADIFANQQKYAKSLLPYEIFVANIEAGNDSQLMIKAIVESYGLVISHKRAPNTICCISCLERVFFKFGYQTLDRTLRLIIGTWEGDLFSLSSNMVHGVAKMVVAFGDELNDDVFKEHLQIESTRELMRTARERGGGSFGIAEALLISYNKKMSKGRLQMNELYNRLPKVKMQLHINSSGE